MEKGWSGLEFPSSRNMSSGVFVPPGLSAPESRADLQFVLSGV